MSPKPSCCTFTGTLYLAVKALAALVMAFTFTSSTQRVNVPSLEPWGLGLVGVAPAAAAAGVSVAAAGAVVLVAAAAAAGVSVAAATGAVVLVAAAGAVVSVGGAGADVGVSAAPPHAASSIERTTRSGSSRIAL